MILVFLSGKGGVGKSTLAKMFYLELTRRGYNVDCRDSDPQQHFKNFVAKQPPCIGNADFTIVDTQGAWTVDNIELVKLIQGEAHKIIVPFKPSEDDQLSAALMVARLESLHALDNTVFVANETHRDFDSDGMRYIAMMKECGVNVSKWQFQGLKSFVRASNTGKARNQVQRFLHEQNIGE